MNCKEQIRKLTEHPHRKLVRCLERVLDNALRHDPNVVLAGEVEVSCGRQNVDGFLPSAVQEHNSGFRVNESGQVTPVGNENGIQYCEFEAVLEQRISISRRIGM